jgi:sugar O-acyltransferase (sialic acid O-acetyltransferase NeuD family)
MDLLVYGSKDFGRLLRELLQHCGHRFAGFIDDFGRGPNVVGTYAEALTTHPPATHGMVIAIGYRHLEARWQAYEKVTRDGYVLPALRHATAIVHPGAAVGAGAIVMAGANVDAFSRLGELAVLWPGTLVSHDCEVGRNCFLSPGAILCGFVRTGRNCFIGAGAVIVDHRELPDASFVKAGSVYK